MSARTKDVIGVYLLIAVVGAAVWAVSCKTDPPTIPDPVVDQPAAPAEQPPDSPVLVADEGSTWTKNGLKVTVIYDEWGPGGCHTNGGLRKFLLENLSDVTKYSRLAAYTSKKISCATQEHQTGKPSHGGCTEIQPGEKCEYWVRVKIPDGKNVCTLQVDDSWGPGGIQESSFVVGDAFNAPKSKCDICIEDPKETKEEDCSKWGECKKVSDGEAKGRFCVIYLSNSGSGYYIKQNGSVWKDNLTLSRGHQNTCWDRSNLNGANLCLYWKDEKIDCARARCGETDFSKSWHGDVTFRCEQEPVCEQTKDCWSIHKIDYKCKDDFEDRDDWTEKRSCECPS